MLAAWGATLSGLALPFAPTLLLVVHLASGAALLLALGAFLRQHAWPRRHTVWRHRNARYGLLALGCLLLLVLSGLALLRWTNVEPLRWTHRLALLALAADLGFHMAWRLRRARGAAQPTTRVARRVPLRLVAVVLPALLIVAAAGVARATNRPNAGVAAPAVPVVHAGLGDHTLVGAGDCATCHGEITDQWKMSAHANAATDPYYLALTGLFIQERGVEAARYCATCHNPIGLLQGEVDEKATLAGGAAGNTQAGYQARKLDKPMAISAHAAEGVSCAVCHQANEVAESPANGSLGLATNIAVLPNDTLSRLSLTAAPANHREEFARPVLEQAALCGSCHNLSLPNGGPAIEPTYDEWLASPYPAEGKSCQTCHLPETPGQKVATGLPGTIRAHGGVPGAPSSLPGVANDPALLRSAATLEAVLRPDPANPSTLIAAVAVTNSGAGHYLPTGADDLRQVWLEATVRDAAGQIVWQSGVPDAHGTLAPGTVQFRKVLGDAQGQPIALHRFWVTDRILEDTRLAPKERREISYAVPLDAGGSGPYRLTVRLLYQDVPQSFAEFAFNRPVPDHPTFEMAAAEAEVRTP